MIDQRPLIMHVLYRFSTGGLENGVVNLINHLPEDRFRHAILALSSVSLDFARRITRDDVQFIELHKGPGHAIRIYPRLYRIFKDMKPDIVHSRNLAALETQVPAMLAGVPVRIHGEHGWDLADPDGRSIKNRFIRRLYKPFVHSYIALSRHLESYLRNAVGVGKGRLDTICNGVDLDRFSVRPGPRELLETGAFNDSRFFVIGTVGRLQAVKDQLNLVRAFAHLLQQCPDHARKLRLAIIGDGPMRQAIEAEITHLQLNERVWLAGERKDVAQVMRSIDLFVLPSRAEGISNTILEAMASGLPVVATDVGGNSELVAHGQTGVLCPAGDPVRLARAMAHYVTNREIAIAHGKAGRIRVEEHFSLQGMVARYAQLYDRELARAGRASRSADALAASK